MKRLLCTAVLLGAVIFAMNAQNDIYSQLWSKVRKAEKEGKPQTAAGYLRELEEKTVRAGDELEQLAVSEALLDKLREYDWKEANAYRPVCTALRNRVLRDSLDAYIVKYQDHPRVVRLLWQRLQDRKQALDRYGRTPAATGEDYLALREEALALLKHKDVGTYRRPIRSFIDGMDSRSFHTDEYEVLAPGAEAAYNFVARNVRTVEMTLYRLPDNTVFTGGYYADAPEVLRRRGERIASQTIRGFHCEYNIEETLKDSCKVVFPKAGVYVVLFDAGNGVLQYDQVYVSDVVGATRLRDGKVELYALDYRTGRPLADATVRLYKNPFGNNRSALASLTPWKNETVRFDGFRPAEAATRVVGDRENSYMMRIDAGQDSYAPLMNLPTLWGGRYPRPVADVGVNGMQACLLTDRMLYRPADTICFKLICYEAGQTSGKVLSGQTVRLTIRPVSSTEPVAETVVVTNDFGSAAGSFILPEGSPNGTYLICTEQRTLKNIRVEEYKRPDFAVSLLPVTEALVFGDIVRQRGQLRSYAGFSVAGGEVRYTVTRSGHNRTSGRYLGEESVLEGTVLSDNDGAFEIVFPAVRPTDEVADGDIVWSSYRIAVRATDPQGETHESATALYVADIPLDLEFRLPDNAFFEDRLIIDKDRVKDVTVACMTLGGAPYAAEGNYSVADSDGKAVAEGRFRAGEAIACDFAALPSGEYVLKAAVEFRGRSISAERKVVVLSADDRKLPFTSPYFYYPVKTEGAIEFVLGTTEEDLYLEMELFDNDSLLSREAVCLHDEMRRFVLPYEDRYRSAVKLSVFGVRDGQVYNNVYQFTRPGDVRLDVAVETFRDKTTPGSEETMTVRAPSGSELAVSIYDATTDRYGANNFVFRPLQPYASVSSPMISTTLQGVRMYNLSRGLMMKNSSVDRMYAAEEAILFDAADEVSVTMAPMLMAGAADEAPESETEDGTDLPEFEGRTNFSERIAFYPQITADPSGRTEIRYTAGDLLGTFCVRVLAHDRQLHIGDASAEFIVQKELMVLPSLPLFATEGDRIVLKSKIVNLSERELKGTAFLELSDENGNRLHLKGIEKQPKTLLAGAQDEASWTVEVPGGTRKLTAKIWFATPTASDGEQHEIQVVPATVTLTEAASFVLGGRHDHKYYEKQLRKQFGAAHPVIEYAEYSTLDAVMESLPEPVKPESDNAIEWIDQLYINQMRNHVRQDDPSACAAFRKQAFSKLKTFQGADGGIQWFQGMRSNSLLTLYFLEKIGQLRSVGAFTPDEGEMTVIRRALRYVDGQIAVQGSYRPFHPFHLVRDFSVRSLWFDIPLTEEAVAVYKRFISETEDGWQKISILEKAQLCNLLLRAAGTPFDGKDFDRRVRLLRESLKDYAVENATAGCYFPNAVMPYRGLMNNEIYAHAQLMETFSRLGEKKMVDGIAQWLLLQKHNQAWENTVATTDAVHALVSCGAKDLRLGAVYYTYTTKLEQVQASANELSVKRRFVRAGTDVPLAEGERLQVGDRITVIYEIDNSENRSFVQMRAMRPACFYPADERSGYSWYGCYREVRPSETRYYWELLPEEHTTVSETFYVQQEGVFSSGLAEIECLYAREYRGHTGSVSVVAD